MKALSCWLSIMARGGFLALSCVSLALAPSCGTYTDGKLAPLIQNAKNAALPPERPLISQAMEQGPREPKLPPSAKCSWRHSTGLQHYRDFVALDPNSAEIWAGNAIQSKSLDTGAPERIRLPRRAGRIALTGLQATGENAGVATYFRDIEHPSLGTYQDAVASVLNGSTFSTPGVWTFDVRNAYETSEAKYQLGVAAAFRNVSGSINLGKEKTTTRNSFVMKFVQKYYTINFEAPLELDSVFEPGVTVEQARAFMYPGNEPAYISEVTYGRQVFVKIESNYSLDVIKAALTLSITMGKSQKGVQQNAANSDLPTCKTTDNGKTCCDPIAKKVTPSGDTNADKDAQEEENKRAYICQSATDTCKTSDRATCARPSVERPTDQDVCDALKRDAECKSSKACLDIAVGACASKVMSDTYIEAWGVGGSAGDAGKIALANSSEYFDKLASYIEKGSDFGPKSPGAPISYKVRSLRDNAVMAIANPLDFKVPSCIVGETKPLKIELVSVDIGAGLKAAHDSSFAFCAQTNPTGTAWTCNSDGKVPAPSENSEPVLLSSPSSSSANRRINNDSYVANQRIDQTGTYFWLLDNQLPSVTKDIGLTEGQAIRIMTTLDLPKDWQGFDATLTYRATGNGSFAWTGPIKVVDASSGLVRLAGKVRSNPPFESNRGSSANSALFRLTVDGTPLVVREGE